MAAHSVTVDELASHTHFGSARKDNGLTAHTDPKNGRFKFDGAVLCSDKYERSDNPPVWNWWCTTLKTGDDKAHNTLQPSKAVYIWTRTT